MAHVDDITTQDQGIMFLTFISMRLLSICLTLLFFFLAVTDFCIEFRNIVRLSTRYNKEACRVKSYIEKKMLFCNSTFSKITQVGKTFKWCALIRGSSQRNYKKYFITKCVNILDIKFLWKNIVQWLKCW